MSIRPNISGFSLNKLQSLAGCKDQTLLHELQKSADGSELKQIIHRYVMDGAPFADLDAETSFHCLAADSLAGFEQTHSATDSNFWKWSEAFKELAKHRKNANSQLLQIFGYLENGRPLFGQRFDADSMRYAYLTHEELDVLLETIKPPKSSKQPEWDSEYMENLFAKGFIDEHRYESARSDIVDTSSMSFDKAFSVWCKTFHASGKDLWMVCS